MQLMKCDIMKPTETVLKSSSPDEVISVLQVVVTLAFVSDSVSQKMLTKDMLKALKSLCAHKNPEVSLLPKLAKATAMTETIANSPAVSNPLFWRSSLTASFWRTATISDPHPPVGAVASAVRCAGG